MTRYCLSMALLRVVLPSGLLIAIALRPFGLSIIYAILLLISPFPGLPNKRTVNKGFISKFSLLCLLVSTVFLMLQIAWYAVYARGIVPSELVLDIAHNMGFVSVEDELLITQACIPEMVMVLVSLAVTVVVYKLKSPIRHSTKPPGTHEKNKFQKFPVLVSAGRYICLFLLMFSGIMKPGVVSGVYFLVFLCAATAWSFGCSLRKGFAVVGACVAGVMAAHVLLLLVYQWTFVMELYPPGNPVARYMGFSKLVHLENTTSVEFSYVRLSNQHWATAFSPIVILLTYYVLAIECRELFKPKRRREDRELDGGGRFEGRLSSIMRRTASIRVLRKPNFSKNGVGFIGTRAHGQSTETDPLLSHGLTGTGTRLQKDSKGSITVRDDESKTSLKDRKFMGELGNAVLNFFKVIIRSSYIATTVIMMAWSIMFHSWLAFVFLMWANVVWLCQDQRRFMLRTSPLLVFYAIFLLLADYVYSMDLLETELPSDIPKINLRQIGLGRMGAAARTALMIKSLFTCMFWVTLRQRVTQLRPARDDVSLQFVSVAPSASQTGASGTLTTRAGAWLRAACARCWIYVVVIMMFVIGVTGDRMTIFRIIYMFLFLAFILMFQISWYWWRRLLYIFWITLIMYSMINLILIYIYQFDNFSTIIEEFFYMNVKLQNDLGLARYHPADLFVKLLTPTLFLIMTIMQVHYFHKDFMKMSDPDRPGKDEESSKPSQMTSTAKDKTSAQGPSAAAAAAAAASKNSDSDEDISSLCNEDKSTFKRTHSFAPTDARSLAWRDVLASLCRRAHSLLRRASKKILLFLHMHLIKIIYLSLMLLCVLDVKALHVPIMMIISVLSVASAPQQRLSIIMISILISIYFMANMVYQIDYIQHSYFDVNCTADNPNATSSQNNADWVGFHKTQRRVSFASLMRGYIGVIALITFHSLISYSRTRHTSHVMFPGITRSLADKDVVHCLKFLFNYGFYKFGVEITLISLITTIVSRMDLYAVVYAAWLAALVSLRRAALARVWPAFTGFLVLAVPVQYIIALGAVPEFCVTYPWEGSDDQMVRLRNWLFLPYAPAPPHATKLIFDFLSLTLAARQLRVFRVERARGAAYEGGSNAEDVGADWETMDFSNPVPDFLAQIASWLDVIKRMVFLGMLWVTLAVMFLTGTNRVNPFSIGYLVGSFIFLWQGTDFYLRPKSTILLWWSWLLRYNCIVVIVKTLLQIPACIFESYMQTHACWVVQVLGIGCVDKFAGGTIRHFLKMDYLRTVQTCPVPQDSVGLVWDGLCFAFLILQRRLFHSYYFFRVIDESKATTILASRGAELIEELRQKQMGAQEDQESKILEKIKIKMERIKANQQRIHGISKEPKHHDIEEESESGSASARVPLVRGDSDASAREFHSPAATPSPPASPPPSPPASAPRGFHTPRSPASPRYRSPAASPPPAPAPPSPSSALMTVSLEAYLEPRRISFESPPSSLPRAPSPESYPVFSPPPRRRHTLASPAPPRMSLVSQCSREPHSHHTYGAEGPAGPDGPVRRECTNRHRGRPLKPPSSHQQAVRSGDYYMFDEFDDTEVQLKDDASEDDDDGPTEMGFGQLLSAAYRTDVRRAVLLRRASAPAGRAPRRASCYSGPLSLEHYEERRSGDLQKTEPLSEHMDEYLSQIDPEKQTVPERIAHLWDTASEFTSSILISLTRSVMKFSRDYRYVSRTLSAEKMSLKSKPDFGIGVREGSQMIWEPPRDCSSVQHRRQLMESTEGLDSNLLNPAAETGRKLSSLSVPEIRILAASVERGLDASPTPSRHSRHSRAASRRSRESDGTSEHESMFSLQTSESMDTLKEHDESAFRQGKSPLVYLGYAVWYAVLAHTDIVCYLMVFINQIQSATILSIPLPLMVFLWGTLTIPRPTKTFWVTLIAYTEVIVLIKSMFQFEILPWNQKVTPVNMPFTAPRIIGIERKANYALYDLLLLLIIFWHRFMLKSLGLWKESVPESDVYPDARYPVTEDDARLLAEGKTGVVGKKYMILHKTDTPRNMMPLSTAALEEQAGPSRTTDEHFTVDDDKQPIIAVKTQVEDTCDHYPGVLVLSLRRYLQPARAFFTYMLQPGARVTADVYAYMFLCDFFNFLVVIFGFAAFGTHQGDGGVKAYIEENKVPIPFLVMLILQFALIVIDRALYLRKFMLGKILFQYALIVGVHIWMFFVLPFITERTFNTMLPPPMWYVVKCVYLLLSAYQIRCGYPRRIIGNFLCKSYQFINIMLFRAFVAVPFVFELRTLMDWIWTDTSMTLMDWLKMEDIFASVFLLKCSRNMEDKFPQARGSRKSPVSKYLLGGSVLAFVIAIIWFPLVFFAFGNTVGEPNPPTDVTVKIRIGPFLPIYQMSAQSNNINKFTEQDYNQLSNLYARDRTAQTFLSNYLYDDVAVVTISPNSTLAWGISPPELDRLELEAASNASITIKFAFVITHPSNNNQNPPSIEESRSVELPASLAGAPSPERDKLAAMLAGNASDADWLNVKMLFPKFLKVFNKGTAKPAYQLTPAGTQGDTAEDVAASRLYRDVQLRLERDRGAMYWRVREACHAQDFLLSVPHNDCSRLVMYTFNDKLFPETLNLISGGGIIGLYTTFVFLASRVLRSFFSGIYTKIMFDDLPYVDRVLQLCLDIYLVREAVELKLEEDLFAKLVFLYRSPETMIKWTRPKEEVEEQRALPAPPN